LSAVVDTGSHLFLGVVVDRGPKPDDLEFHRVARQAHRRHPFDALLADVGYDAEHHHEFLHDELGVLGIIPPQRGRPHKTPSRHTRGFFRQFLKDHWPVAEYGQRWQVETDFSMLKRLLGSAVRSRKRHSIDREIVLRTITINLMILWRLLCCFQQSKPVPFSARPEPAGRSAGGPREYK
jgi:transposase